jgi:site-specific recombinase XerD
MSETALQTIEPLAAEDGFAPALRNAIRIWAESTTGLHSYNRPGLIGDKKAVIEAFFDFAGKTLDQVDVLDVESWIDLMQGQGLKPNTVYARISRLASFFEWLRRDPELSRYMASNPARPAMPKRPKPYQSEATKSYTDEEMNALLAAVRVEAEAGSIKAKRDYALLLIYFFSGLRRREVTSLRGCDVEIKGEGMVIHCRRKGGRYSGRELVQPAAVNALKGYLTASGRSHVIGSALPLWTRHDRAGQAGAPLCSHAFAKNLKAYGEKAGVKNVRIHRTRHTFGRLVAEQTGSLIETQDALDHADLSTTRVYVERIVIKKDKHSHVVAARLDEKAILS